MGAAAIPPASLGCSHPMPELCSATTCDWGHRIPEVLHGSLTGSHTNGADVSDNSSTEAGSRRERTSEGCYVPLLLLL